MPLLAQALAKQAKVKAQHAVPLLRNRSNPCKSRICRYTVILYNLLASIEPFKGKECDQAIRLTGSGAPNMTLPIRATSGINKFVGQGWRPSKTLRVGRNGKRGFIELIFEKPRPEKKITGKVVGMESNYKTGFVFSDGQVIGQAPYPRIQSFGKQRF